MRLKIAVLAVAALCTAGCGDGGAFGDHWGTKEVRMRGHDYTCLTWRRGYAGGLSCNWSDPH